MPIYHKNGSKRWGFDEVEPSTIWQNAANHNAICEQAYLLHLIGTKFNFEYLAVRGKRPIDSDGTYLTDWPNKSFTIKECLASKDVTGIGVKSGLNLLCLDFDGQSAFEYAWNQESINWMGSGCEIHRDDNPWRMKALSIPTAEQLKQLPYGEFQSKVKTAEGEALEVFLTRKRQVVIIGKHPGGGNYFWPRGFGPKAIKPPSDATWNFVLKLANQQDAPKETKYCRSSSPVKRLNPCPICGRNRDLWCGETPEGLILCMNGNTFSAERRHGPLKITDVVDGQWALVAKSESCNTFKPHTPLTRRSRKTRKRKPPSHKYRRSAHVS